MIDNRTLKTLFAVGMLLNGALYLACVFVAALLSHKESAEWLALAAMGATYLCFYAGWMDARPIAALFNGLAIVGGIIAGILLVVL